MWVRIRLERPTGPSSPPTTPKVSREEGKEGKESKGDHRVELEELKTGDVVTVRVERSVLMRCGTALSLLLAQVETERKEMKEQKEKRSTITIDEEVEIVLQPSSTEFTMAMLQTALLFAKHDTGTFAPIPKPLKSADLKDSVACSVSAALLDHLSGAECVAFLKEAHATLHYPALVDLACAKIASILKRCTNMEEMRAAFGVVDPPERPIPEKALETLAH